MDTYEADVIIIGAGVIGLACGRALAMAGREVIILEAESLIASHTSSRNSEVIHAGLYYAKDSLKAKFCVTGRRALYDYLDAHGVEVKRCGKLVVATSDEEAARLDRLLIRARENGVKGLDLIDGPAARTLESALTPDTTAAMHSTVSGIFDSHSYFLSLQGEIEDRGGMVAFETPVISGAVKSTGIELVTGGDAPAQLTAPTVINAAGHAAVSLAACITGPHTDSLPTPRFVKGSYFSITGKTPFTHLIYPMPTASSLGLHLTVDLGGRGKVGPDAEWLDADAVPPFDYEVDPAQEAKFYKAVRHYWPGLVDGALAPDYSGVRPKLVEPGEPSGDFIIERSGTSGLINLMGIESPGLTSSLAIADHVAAMVAESV